MSLNVTQNNQNLTLHVSQSNIKATLSVTQNVNELHITAIQNNEITKLQPIVNTSSSDFIETDPIFQASEASLFVTGDKANLDNQSSVNSGDETTLSIQTKRPLKTINGESLEGSGNVQIDYNDLDNLPTIPIPLTNHSDLNLDDGTNPHGTTKSDVGLGNVPNLDTTNAVNDSHTHSNKSILDAITESFTTGLKTTYDSVVNWVSINGSNLINHLSNTSNPHNTTKSQVGLGNVDNTSDIDKPISTATQNALDSKADLVGGKVPTSQLPSYVDDVIEGYFNVTNFYTDALFTNLITPESGKIYINLAVTPATQYRWSGSAYKHIGGGANIKKSSRRSNTPQGNGSTVINNIGQPALTAYGTLSGNNMSTYPVNYFKSLKTVSAGTGTTAGTSAGWRNSSVYTVFRFETELEHNFFFGNNSVSFVSDCRMFVGFRSVINQIANVEPSVLGAGTLGVGFDSTYNNFRFYYNPLSPNVSTIDLGSNFVKSNITDFFQFTIYTPKNSWDIHLTLKNMVTGVSHTEIVTYDSSKQHTLWLENIHINNNTSAQDAKIALGDNINDLYY